VSPGYTIRSATLADIDAIVAFTLAEAREAEARTLDADAVRRGVAAAFERPPRAVYWVVETADGRLAASTSVVTEWSNFHGSDYWWVQSLYIAPEHRGAGLVDRLLDHLAAAAARAGALDLRLYAHASNDRAHRVYERCGFERAPYVIMRRTL
jgi:ribosomal protein S18 acetylase RimI-like enzyme